MMVNRLNRNRRISRILVVAIALVLVAGLFCGAGAAATSLAWSNYDGSQSGDITITEASGNTLNHKATLTISQDATLDFGDAKTYVLTGSVFTSGCGGLVDNLVFSDASKTLTIKNLHITGSGTIASTTYGIGGLFGRIESTNGTLILENCSINGVTITGTASGSSYAVGGLVGIANSANLNIEMRNCTIENCNISSSSGDVGGLVGYAGTTSLNMSGCMVTFSNITSSSSDVGGLVGSANSAGSLNMSGCMVDRAYVVGGNGCVGGLVGRAYFTSVVNCANTIVNGTEVTSSSDNVGGLVGSSDTTSLNMSGCRVEECTVCSTGNIGVGGLVGFANPANLNLSGCVVENCTVWSSNEEVGGLVGRAVTVSIGFIGDGCWVNDSWVSGTSQIGSLMGLSYNTSITPLVAPLHSAVYSASTTTGSSAIANNDFDGIGTKEQYGSPIDRYGLVAGKDYGYICYKPGIIDSGTCGANLTWVLTDDGTLTISGTGAMDDYSYRTAPWYSYRSQMTKLVLPNGLTTIGDYAFQECSGFTGYLTIPNHVTTIGTMAFLGCDNFTGPLTIPNSVTIINSFAFCYCSGFTGSLTLSDNLTTIDLCAFTDCSGFTGSLTIPNNVISIQKQAFSNCGGFTGSLTIPNSVTTISELAFSGCSGFAGSLIIPNSVTSIGDLAFQDCSGFTGSLALSNNLTTIGANPFSSCSNISTITVDLSNPNYSSDSHGILYNKNSSSIICCPAGKRGEVTIPNSVRTIAEYAFCGCSAFNGSLTIPNSVTTISEYAFHGCSGFNGPLTIPNSVTTISECAFHGCSGFNGSLTIPNSVASIDSFAFSQCSGFTGPLTIPNSITTIRNGAFSQCSGFTGPLTIPNSVTTIGELAFFGCNGFSGSLIIGNNVMTIGSDAFNGCYGITNVTIPSSVTSIASIGGNVFVSLHQNSIIYAECSTSLVSGNYSTDRTALAEKGTNNAYTFTVDSTSFPSGFSLTSDNAPVKENYTFAGWYATSSYSGSTVSTVTNGQTLYAKWMAPTTHQLSAGWNVVSVPHTPTAAYDTVSELFAGVDTADHSIYVYNGKTKVWEPATSSTAISPLNAYWVYAASPTVISCLYDTSSTTLPSMSVYTGWNLVGISAPESISAATAFTSVDWQEYHEWNASAQGYNPTLIKGGSGTAADTNNVSIWNGGWLSMNTNGTYTGSI